MAVREFVVASAGQVLLGLLVAVVAFILVVVVCAGVLGLLQLVLPRTDSGAEQVHRRELLREALDADAGADGEDADAVPAERSAAGGETEPAP